MYLRISVVVLLATVQIALKTLFFMADFAAGTDYADVFCKQIRQIRVRVLGLYGREFF
jgi:hypothetical protein